MDLLYNIFQFLFYLIIVITFIIIAIPLVIIKELWRIIFMFKTNK